MSVEHQKKIEHYIEQHNQKTIKTPRHPVVRVLLRGFIILNAIIIVIGLIPVIIPMPFLRNLSLLTPWHFHAGYGTPLGFSLVPAIIVTALSTLLIVISVCFMKRIIPGWLEFCGSFVILLLACIITMVNISESYEDYVRGALLREVPEGVTVGVTRGVLSGGSEVITRFRMTVASDYVLIEEFEPFVLEMQALTFHILQRRNASHFFFDIRHYTRVEAETKTLWWEPLYNHEGAYTIGEYGALLVLNWSSYLHERNDFIHAGQGRFSLPVTSIQETIYAIMLAENFAREAKDEMPSNVDVCLAWYSNDESIPPIEWVVYGKVDIEVRIRRNDYLSVGEVEDYFIMISSRMKSIVENRDMEINELIIWFQLVGYENDFSWSSAGGGDYGKLRIARGGPTRIFEDIHISEVHGLIDSLN